MQEGRELHINGAAIQNEQEPRDINARNTKLAEHDDCNVWTETFGLNAVSYTHLTLPTNREV